MLSNKNLLKLSKCMSYILRHKPDEFGIVLDNNGYVSLELMIDGIHKHGHLSFNVTLDDVRQVVSSCDKQRYKIENGCIRANQGHSIDVDLELVKWQPPEFLYHGTSTKSVLSILNEGICKMERQYVHLSDNLETASKVGCRHGKLVILKVNSSLMSLLGFTFYKSENGVWLTNHVKPEFLEVIK